MSSFNSSPHDGHSPQSFAQERWTDDQIQHGKTRAAGKSLVTIHCISDIRRYLCRAEADIPEASHALLDNLRVQFIFVDGCTWPAFLVTQVSYLLKARQAKAKADDREREIWDSHALQVFSNRSSWARSFQTIHHSLVFHCWQDHWDDHGDVSSASCDGWGRFGCSVSKCDKRWQHQMQCLTAQSYT